MSQQMLSLHIPPSNSISKLSCIFLLGQLLTSEVGGSSSLCQKQFPNHVMTNEKQSEVYWQSISSQTSHFGGGGVFQTKLFVKDKGPVHTGRGRYFDVACNAVWTLPLAAMCSIFCTQICEHLRICVNGAKDLESFNNTALEPISPDNHWLDRIGSS